ncbi:MAG: hypothetical protein ACFFD8_10755, partial [Candidatus Thorarchaeota archaeon]
LKLLTHGHETLPPLFLVNPPDLNPKLFQWLSARYASVKSPLVIFDTKSEITTTNLHIPYNYIVTNSNIAPPSPIRQNLTKDEQLFLKDNCDYMAVRLQSIPETCFVTIF